MQVREQRESSRETDANQDAFARVPQSQGHGTDEIPASVEGSDSGSRFEAVDDSSAKGEAAAAAAAASHADGISTSNSTEPNRSAAILGAESPSFAAKGRAGMEESKESDGRWHSPQLGSVANENLSASPSEAEPSAMASSNPDSCDSQAPHAASAPADGARSPSEQRSSGQPRGPAQHRDENDFRDEIVAPSTSSDLPPVSDQVCAADEESALTQSAIESSPPRQTASISSPTSELASLVEDDAAAPSPASSTPRSSGSLTLLRPGRPLVSIEEVPETPRGPSPAPSDHGASQTAGDGPPSLSATAVAGRASSPSILPERESSPVVQPSKQSASPNMNGNESDSQEAPQWTIEQQKPRNSSSPSLTTEERAATEPSLATPFNAAPESMVEERTADACQVSQSPFERASFPQTDCQMSEPDMGPYDSGEDTDLSSPLQQKKKRGFRPRKTGPRLTPAPLKRNTGHTSGSKQCGPSSGARSSGTIVDAIRRSYAEFGLDGQNLRISYSRDDRHPLTLAISHATVKLSQLTRPRVEKLHRAMDEMLTHLPTETDGAPGKTNIDLVRRLSEKSLAPIQACSLVEAAAACEKRAQISNDEVRLWQFLQSLALLAASRHDQNGVRHTET